MVAKTPAETCDVFEENDTSTASETEIIFNIGRNNGRTEFPPEKIGKRFRSASMEYAVGFARRVRVTSAADFKAGLVQRLAHPDGALVFVT